jgi:hypothetical protein
VKLSKLIQQPAGVHVDALHEIRKAMRALRRAEYKIMAHVRADKRQRAKAAPFAKAST